MAALTGNAREFWPIWVIGWAAGMGVIEAGQSFAIAFLAVLQMVVGK